MRFSALLLLASLAVSPALADDALTFIGTLDGRDIVVELTDGKTGPVFGRYTFHDTGGDVPLLAVSHDAGHIVLNEEAPCDETTCKVDDDGNAVDPPIAAVWTLDYDPETYMADGTRQTTGDKPKSTRLEFSVMAWRTLDAAETATPFGLHDRSATMGYDRDQKLDWAAAPYEMTVLETEFAVSPDEHIGEATVHYVTDPRTKFPFPRIVSFDDGSSVEAANLILAERHGRMNLSAFDCLAFQYATYGRSETMAWSGGTLADYDGESVTMSYASPRLISWEEAGSLWCNGAHPYNHIDNYTYDLETRDRLDFAKVFSAWVPREWGAALDEVASAEDVKANPEGYHWGPSADMVAYVRDTIPDDVFDAELNETCMTDEALSEHLDLRFADGEQVVLTLSGFPHVIGVCNGDLFTVPLAELGAFLAPGAGAYFPGLE